MRMSGASRPKCAVASSASASISASAARDVGAAERLDAGLQEFAGLVAAIAEDRAEIAEIRALAGRGRGEIVARRRGW